MFESKDAFANHCKRKDKDRYATFDDGTRLYDDDVAKFAWKHLSWLDRFNFRKVVSAGLASFAIMQDEKCKDKDNDNWKFDF